MKREDFKQIIKLRSFWIIDKRKGNYKLPSGDNLREYVYQLVKSQMDLDCLGIAEDGNLYMCRGGAYNFEKEDYEDIIIMPAFRDNEAVSYDEHNKRIDALVREII